MTQYVGPPGPFIYFDGPPYSKVEVVKSGKDRFPAGDPDESGITRQQRRHRERQAAKAARRTS